MLHAINSGHKGSMCTGHANSCYEMLKRLTSLVMAGSSLPYDAIVTQLSMGLDLMIHISRNKEGKRFIDEISRVLPTKGNDFELMKLYTNEGGDHFVRHCSTDILTEIAQYKG